MLRIIRGDQAADDGVVTIDGGLGVMDQFVGHGEAGGDGAPASGARRPCAHPRGGRGARVRRERADRTRRARHADGLRVGDRRVRGCGRLRARDPLGPVHDRSPRCAVRARQVSSSSPPSPAESRSGSRSRPCCAARMRCCFSTSRNNYLDVPTKEVAGGAVAADLEDRVCWFRTTGSCSHAPPIGSSRLEPRRRRRHGLGARRRIRHVPAGEDRPDGPAGRAAPALGRAAREAAHPGGEPQGEGLGERRLQPRAIRPPRPACASSRRSAPPESARPPRSSTCGCAAPARASGRGQRSAWN